ncbi:c-type cytochrome [Almyronema epifaneia]|uniref:C-type cytochrome n=1 Tax=Almyronema epifaneia S1 TaxID=2991925 RepID=A0ABW6IKM3_9CYAN
MKFLSLPDPFCLICRRGLLSLLALALSLLIIHPAVADTATANPTQLFEIHCAGCHAHGGNIVRRGKTLKLKALQRNQVASVAAIADLITHGKNNMSAFGDRLSADEIQTLAVYVRDQADRNWRSPATDKD